MKLGKETGSLVNHLLSGKTPTTPEVGMGATILGWTDRHAATVIAVSKSGKQITVQQDTATRTDKNGMSESQDYAYTPNPNGSVTIFTLRKDGRWTSKLGGNGLMLGARRSYHDFSF